MFSQKIAFPSVGAHSVSEEHSSQLLLLESLQRTALLLHFESEHLPLAHSELDEQVELFAFLEVHTLLEDEQNEESRHWSSWVQ